MSDTKPAGTMRAHLRSVTKPAHERLENTLNLLDATLDLNDYRRLLERFYGFWRSWEPLLAARLRDDTFFGERRRLHLLAHDLLTLGVTPEALDGLPVCPPLVLRDSAAALGSLYVMEGSTLGGRVIQQNVEACLKLTAQSGCRYFAGYGTGTGLMWRAFLKRLEDAPEHDAASITSGAIATFEGLAAWLGDVSQNRIIRISP